MSISDGLLIDAATALAKAGASGLGIDGLSKALWPDTSAKSHGAAGRVVAELQRRGWAALTPGGGRRKRIALTREGEAWFRSFSVEGSEDDAAQLESYEPRYQPPPPAPVDPIEAAIAAASSVPPHAPLPPWTSPREAYEQGRALGRRAAQVNHARLVLACAEAGDASGALLDAAFAEVVARTDAQIRQLEAQIRAAGGDPHAFSH